ncbi:hypothetical protein Tco_0795814 [Tanacetum coccineum]
MEKIVLIKQRMQAAQDQQKSYADQKRKPMEFEVGDRVMLKVSPWKGVVRFEKQGKLNPRYVEPFKVLAKVGKVAYELELTQELSRVHHTFHVSNLKKCYADEPLVMPLEGIHVDDKLQFVEEPVEIMEREIKRLKRSRIPLVKVRWNSRRGPEFTWEREDSFKQKYPQLFTNRASSSTTRYLTVQFILGYTISFRGLPVEVNKARVIISSATSAVTYTSVYTDFEPGRAFWGANNEEVSEGGIPWVIVLGYDRLPIQSVAPPSPDYIPGPEDPQTPPVPQDEDEHEFLAEEQPLPPIDSPTAESPGHVTESDPEEDPEEYEDDETEDGPVDYPMDGGDDGDDDDGDSSRDDANDEDEDDEDEEEEEEHIAPADSTIVAPVDEPVFPPEGTEPVIPPPSTDITIGARVTVRPQTSISLPPEAEVERLLTMTTPSPSPPISLSPPPARERLARCMAPPAHLPPLLPLSGCPTQIQTLRITSTQALIDAVTAVLPSPPLPPLLQSLYIPPPIDHRDDIPESEQPPRKRLYLSTLGSKYKVGESSTARPTRGQRIDYGFVSTVDAEERRQGIKDVGYGIRGTWVDPTEAVLEIAPMTVGEVNIRVTELAELHEHDIQDLYALLEDAQDSRSRISQRVDMDSQRVDLLMGDRMTLQEAVWMVEEEAYASREAWAHSIGLSQATHQELQTHRDHVYAHKTHLQVHQTQLQLQSILIQTQHQVHETRFQMQQAELAALRETDRRRQDQMGEIKKLEIKLWNLKVKGNDVPAYTERFQELTLICTKFVANETEKVDKRQPWSPTATLQEVECRQGLQYGDRRKEALWGIFAQVQQVPSPPQWPVHPEVLQVQQNRALCSWKNKRWREMEATRMGLMSWDAEKRGNAAGETLMPNVSIGSLINIAPTSLENCYDVELADGKLVEIDTIIRGCTLNFLDHPFNSRSICRRTGVVSIHLRSRVHGQRMAAKISAKKAGGQCRKEEQIKDVQIVRDFPEVFPRTPASSPARTRWLILGIAKEEKLLPSFQNASFGSRSQQKSANVLGLAGYYRRFIEGFSKIAKSMTKESYSERNSNLTGMKEECAFSVNKQKLCAPISGFT